MSANPSYSSTMPTVRMFIQHYLATHPEEILNSQEIMRLTFRSNRDNPMTFAVNVRVALRVLVDEGIVIATVTYDSARRCRVMYYQYATQANLAVSGIYPRYSQNWEGWTYLRMLNQHPGSRRWKIVEYMATLHHREVPSYAPTVYRCLEGLVSAELIKMTGNTYRDAVYSLTKVGSELLMERY